MRAVSRVIGGQVIAIDGKVLRRSHDKGIGQAAIDMVSAWATANHLFLGQVKVEEQSNEITAIPQLLEALEVAGCIVTIGAIGCQTDIAEKIIDRDAEYVLALKENQGNLYEDVERLFINLKTASTKPIRSQRWLGEAKSWEDRYHMPVSLAQNGFWDVSAPTGGSRMSCTGYCV